MKLTWLGYLVCSLGNCAMKLCIETDLSIQFSVIAREVINMAGQIIPLDIRQMHASLWSGTALC